MTILTIHFDIFATGLSDIQFFAVIHALATRMTAAALTPSVPILFAYWRPLTRVRQCLEVPRNISEHLEVANQASRITHLNRV
jgi:hypothetical protein